MKQDWKLSCGVWKDGDSVEMERSGQSKQPIEEIKQQDFVMDRSWSLREREVSRMEKQVQS